MIAETIADWVVYEVHATGSEWYPLRVVGRNLSDGGEFRWVVRDIDNPRYDLTHARIDPRAEPFIKYSRNLSKVGP